MGSISFDVVIPTYQRVDVLATSLAVLSEMTLPAELRQILVVENGGKCGAEELCRSLETSLPVRYLYREEASLTGARNAGVEAATGDFVLFIDDDIRPNDKMFDACLSAFERYGTTAFYGGPLAPDYEAPPPDWLIDFLPWSAKGHSLGEQERLVDEPLFLGGNLAVPRMAFEDVRFEGPCATGRDGGGVGEETRLQAELLTRGYKGVYVPGALVYHKVPSDNCTPAYVRHRRWRHGFGEGEVDAAAGYKGRHCCGAPLWYWRNLVGSFGEFLHCQFTFAGKTARFNAALKFYEATGRISGYRHARKLDAGKG